MNANAALRCCRSTGFGIPIVDYRDKENKLFCSIIVAGSLYFSNIMLYVANHLSLTSSHIQIGKVHRVEVDDRLLLLTNGAF